MTAVVVGFVLATAVGFVIRWYQRSSLRLDQEITEVKRRANMRVRAADPECACEQPWTLRNHAPGWCDPLCQCLRRHPDPEPTIHGIIRCQPEREHLAVAS